METVVTIRLDEVETNENVEPVDRKRYSVSPYARWFNEKCVGWCKDSETNKFFLLHQQAYANELLKARGYLFLNEIYDMLGIPRTKAGQVVGWVFDKENPIGDNFVNFGLYDNQNEDFVNGYENSILLDFNVDGMILDRL